MSVVWYAQRLGCRVVVSVRHPASFVGSWRRLGWTAHLEELLAQPLLMRDLLGPYADELRAANDSTDPVVRPRPCGGSPTPRSVTWTRGSRGS